MNRIAWLMLFVTALFPIAAMSQSGGGGSGGGAPYQPAVPPPSYNTYGGYGGWGGYGGGQTPAGAALNGMASVISAKGDYNLSTSAAAVNMTQAQKNEIQNRQEWTNAYFDMRMKNQQARAAERGPAPTMEQLARIAKEGVPRRLSPSQFDPVNGKLSWPSVLQQDVFADQREEVEQLFSTWARYGGLNYSDQTKARNTIEAMFGELKKQIKDIPPQDYVACRSFLQSLNYAATKSEL